MGCVPSMNDEKAPVGSLATGIYIYTWDLTDLE